MGFTVPFAEDPLRRAGKIDHMWSIRHRIEAGSQDASGRIRRVNPVIIRPGDFVDIAVTLQTVSLRLPRGKRGVEVMLIPQAIVKLVSSEDAMVRSNAASTSLHTHVRYSDVDENGRGGERVPAYGV